MSKGVFAIVFVFVKVVILLAYVFGKLVLKVWGCTC